MSENELGPAVIALLLAIVALYAGVYINPTTEYTVGPEVNVTENPEENSITVAVENLQQRQFKSVSIQTESSTQTVIQNRTVTLTDVPEGTQLKIVGIRKGQSSVYDKTKTLYNDSVSYAE